MATHKEIRKLIGLARMQGWRVEQSGGHAKFYLPPGRTTSDGSTIYVTSSTPSSENIIRTIKSDLDHAGLVLTESEWKRRRRETKKLLSLPMTPKLIGMAGPRSLHVMQEIIQSDSDFLYKTVMMTPDGKLAAEMNDLDTIALIMSMMSTWTEWHVICACGHTATTPLGLMRHMMKESNFISRTETEIAVDGTGHGPAVDYSALPCELQPDFIPDPSLAVRCPINDCRCWVFITQPHVMQAHLEERHGLHFCAMGCGMVLPTAEAQILHTSCCYKNPEAVINRPVWEARRKETDEWRSALAVMVKSGPPSSWPTLRVKNLSELHTCVVKGPETGTPYNAMPCRANCGAPIGLGRPRQALCGACTVALDVATKAVSAEAESLRAMARNDSEKAAGSTEKITSTGYMMGTCKASPVYQLVRRTDGSDGPLYDTYYWQPLFTRDES